MSKEKQIEEMSAEIREAVNGCSSYWSGLIAEHLHEQGYRKQSEVIDEFAERLKEEMNYLSRMEYHCDPYFLVSRNFIDKIAEKMKGGERDDL